MRRNATLKLESFDPDVLAAARDVAQRAGVPLEAWLESVVAGEPRADKRRPKRQSPPEAPISHPPHQPRSEGDPVRQAAPPSGPPAAQRRQERPDLGGASIEAMMRRLDALDRNFAEDRRASADAAAEAASRAFGQFEERLVSALGGQTVPSGALTDRLAEIERRIGELHVNAPGTRPLGRRGRPVVEEVRDAIDEIKHRQRELEDGGEPSARSRKDAAEPSPAIAELQTETTRLRESLGSLATGQDIGALEQAMRALVSNVEHAREPADLAAIQGPLDLIRVQIERLADDVAENVNARVSSQVERLAGKVDGAIRGGAQSFADQDAIGGLFSELEQVRHQIAALAGPERVQGLAQGLQAISQQISQLQQMSGSANGPGLGELKPLLEEIRRGIKEPDASNAILGRIDALADKMVSVGTSSVADLIQRMERISETLRQTGAAAGGDSRGGAELRPLLEEIRRDVKAPEASRAILGSINALAHKMEQVNIAPVGELIGRLDSLGESLRRPQVQAGDVVSIQRMLQSLAEKVDRVSVAAGSGGLDALEKQLIAISRRLESKGADSGSGRLENMMADLLNEVVGLRDTASVEAIVERTARTIGAGSAGAGTGDQLHAEIAALRSQQSGTEQRMQATLGNLNATLERLTARLGAPALARAGGEASVDERLTASTAMSAAPVPQRPPVARRPIDETDLAMPAREVLLEPGSGRPPERRPTPSEIAGAGSDIKSNFIAAARRAAQAAQADLDEPVESEPRGNRTRARMPSATVPEREPGPGLMARLRGQIQNQRRHLLLGAAAVVLMFGAFQVIDFGDLASDQSSPSVTEKSPETASQVAVAALDKPIVSPFPDPITTQSISAPDKPAEAIAEAPPAEPKLAAPIEPKLAAPIEPKLAAPVELPKPPIPRVESMASLKNELANLPPALASLRDSALEGDGAAIFDLATREADGRGTPRDLSIAAKLFEKLAAAGYPPAQFKLGSYYEKGQGVVRDIGQARHWYERAADKGNIRAMHNLAVLHAENPIAGGKPDFVTAATWFKRAAEHGVRDSQYNLGVLYARGLGLTQDLIQSYAWFAAAGAQGDDEAGKKREDVAAKLSPKDLASAKAVAASFKPKPSDPAANETPASKASAQGSMSLIGAPPPGAADRIGKASRAPSGV